MARVFALAVMVALVPTLASAQEHEGRHDRPGAGPSVQPRGIPGPALRGGPVIGPQGPHGVPGPGLRGGPVIVPQGHLFTFRGHPIERVRIAPFIYPRGWGYRRWVVGAILPPIFLAPDYFYADWAAAGLTPPPPGYQWVRYGPDLLLVDVSTGQVVDTVYGVFY